MNSCNVSLKAMVSATVLGVLAGCGGISPATKERMAQTETAVKQAQSTLGNSESGALELQRARDHVAVARKALDAGKEGEALRAANEAQLQAELAVAKSQSATARKAAADMQASIEALRNEAVRDPPVTR
jgi:predicted  nucleic acid-binding Zn-ribbon protein